MRTSAGGVRVRLTRWRSAGVARLSPLVPLGPPSSRFTGSAFNPATTGVVLKARAHATPLTVQAMEPDGDGRSPLPALAAGGPVAIAMLPGAIPLRPGDRFSPSLVSFPSFHLLSRQRARAPDRKSTRLNSSP